MEGPFQRLKLYESRDTLWFTGSSSIEVKENSENEVYLSIPRSKSLTLQVQVDRQMNSEKMATLVQQKTILSTMNDIQAIFGFFKSATGMVMVVVTRSEEVAAINGKKVFVVRDHVLIPIAYKPRITMEETRYRNFIAMADINNNVFFSYDYPLHRSWQSCALQRDAWNDEPAKGLDLEASSTRFVWNAHAMAPLLQLLRVNEKVATEHSQEDARLLSRLFLPFICGYVGDCRIDVREAPRSNKETPGAPSSTSSAEETSSDQSKPNSEGQADAEEAALSVQYVLISRRSTAFAGTRHLRRGMNVRGDVANEVETEQLLIRSDRPTVASYVQYRGSIPLFWHHVNLLSPMPAIQFDPPNAVSSSSHAEAMSTTVDSSTSGHWGYLQRRYGRCIHVMNLLRQTPSHREGGLYAAYRDACGLLETEATSRWLQYHDFDLLKDGKTQLHVLVDKLTQAVFETGICTRPLLPPSPLSSPPHAPVSSDSSSTETDGVPGEDSLESLAFEDESDLQHGVLRTNCVDCLDRTNLGQFLAGRIALTLQLEALGLSSDSPPITDTTALDAQPLNASDRLTEAKLTELQSKLLALWTKNGDSIALQYAGSSAMHRMEEKTKEASAADSKRSGKSSAALEEQVDVATYLQANAAHHAASSSSPEPASSSISPLLLVGEPVEDDNAVLLQPLEEASPTSGAQTPTSPSPLPPSPPSTSSRDSPINDSGATEVGKTIVDTSKLSVVSNLATNAMISLQRYFLNISWDFERQYAFDYLLGNHCDTLPEPVWKQSPYPEKNRGSTDAFASTKAIELLMELHR